MKTTTDEKIMIGIAVLLIVLCSALVGRSIGIKQESKSSMRELMLNNKSHMERVGIYHETMNSLSEENKELREVNAILERTIKELTGNNENGFNIINQEVDTIIVRYK